MSFFLLRLTVYTILLSVYLFLNTSALPSARRRGSYSELPDLLDVTTEELAAGLEDRLFTSVDLVKVSHYQEP
jgi:hypothetical protein